MTLYIVRLFSKYPGFTMSRMVGVFSSNHKAVQALCDILPSLNSLELINSIPVTTKKMLKQFKNVEKESSYHINQKYIAYITTGELDKVETINRTQW